MGQLLAKHRAPEIRGTLSRNGTAMAAVSRHKLTLVIAGPGYGKTTFAAQAGRDLSLNQIWFRPGAVQRGIDSFLDSLIPGLNRMAPGLGLTCRPAGDPEAKVTRFFNELEAGLTHDLFLVVDDCQDLVEDPEVMAFLQTALDRFFPGFHLILAGRFLPPLKFSRLTAEQQVLRVSAADLAFSPKEIQRLFSLRFGISLSGEESEQLWEKTLGWVSGLILFHQILFQQSPGRTEDGGMAAAIGQFKGSQRLVAEYMAENAFDRLSSQERAFLMKVSVLGSLEAGLCNRFLNMGTAGSMLRSIEDRHCFVEASDYDRLNFTLHPLFREYLLDRIPACLGMGQKERLHAGAARLYERENRGEEALVHYIRAGRMEEASRLLNRFARPIIKQDRPHMLESLLSVIPAHYMNDEPWFQYLQAGYYGVCSRLQLAVKAYEKVLQSFRHQKDEQGECLVLMELAEHYLSAGEFKEAEQAYTKILLKNHLDLYLTIIVMGYLIRVLALEGRTSDADRYGKRAMALLRELDNPVELDMGRAWIYVAQGYRYAYSGGYEKAVGLGQEAKALFESLKEHRFTLSAYFLISYACFYLGRFARGSASAAEGIALAAGQRIENEFSEFLVLLRAKNSLEMPGITGEEIDRILVECKNSLAYFQNGGFPGGVAQGCLVLHRAYLLKQDAVRAEQCLRQGMTAVGEHPMPLVKNELNVALSSLLLFDRNPPQKREAFILLKEAEQDLLYSGWHMAWVSRIFARYYWEYGHRETAYKYMVYTLKICEEEGFDAWILGEGEWILPILVSMAALGSMKSYILRLFRQADKTVLGGLSSLQAKAAPPEQKAVSQLLAVVPKPAPLPIRVFFFDRFRLFVGDRQISQDSWRSRKALTLCKYMLAMEHKGFMEREILMELLWPEEDPRKSAQRFHVALASIRKTLEPDILKGNRSSYIRRSGQAYRMVMGKNGNSDLRRFLGTVSSADTAADADMAQDLYGKACAIYTGPFLREDPFEDWCGTAREKYRQVYLSVLKRMLSYFERTDDWAQCIATASTYLELEPYDEEMIQQLMRFHTRTGNRIMASRLYIRFRQAVQEEFNCSVSDETTALYRHLIADA